MLCASAYTAASYRMIDIYIRAAVGEYTALTFLPIVMLGIYLIYEKDVKVSTFYKSAVLAFGMSAIIGTHVMTTEMVAVAIILFGLICYKRSFTKDVIIPVLIAAAETVVLELYFIVPFIDCNLSQKVSVNYLAEGVRVIQKEGAYLSQYFSFFQDIFRVLDDKEFVGTQLTPGPLLMASLCVGCYLIYKKKADKRIGILVVLSLVMLVLSSNLFPWDFVSASSFVGNMLAQIQFPWRYLGLGILFLSALTGYIMLFVDENYGKKASRITFAGLAAAGILGCFIFTGNYIDEAERHSYTDTANLNSYNVGIYEYIMGGTDWTILDGKIKTKNIADYEYERKGSTTILTVKAEDKDATMVLPIQGYRGYVARDAMGQEFELTRGKNNNLKIAIPGGYSGTITIKTDIMLWNICGYVSVLAWCIMIAGFFIVARRQKNGQI